MRHPSESPASASEAGRVPAMPPHGDAQWPGQGSEATGLFCPRCNPMLCPRRTSGHLAFMGLCPGLSFPLAHSLLALLTSSFADSPGLTSQLPAFLLSATSPSELLSPLRGPAGPQTPFPVSTSRGPRGVHQLPPAGLHLTVWGRWNHAASPSSTCPLP